nr:MAG TPA: hypothetical protein [Caudoviricetes sp.]
MFCNNNVISIHVREIGFPADKQPIMLPTTITSLYYTKKHK